MKKSPKPEKPKKGKKGAAAEEPEKVAPKGKGKGAEEAKPAKGKGKGQSKVSQKTSEIRDKLGKFLDASNPKVTFTHRVMSVGLCLGILAVAALAMLTPIVMTETESLTPMMILNSWEVGDLGLKTMPELLVSFYVSLIFYYIYAVILIGCAFFAVMVAITRSSKMHRQTSTIMNTLLFLMLLALLISFNYANTIAALDDTIRVTLSSPIYFSIAVVLVVVKIMADVVLGRQFVGVDIKESGNEMFTSFTQSFIAILALAFPIYIFPGLKARYAGIDIFLNSNDVLSFLPLSYQYKMVIQTMSVLVIASLALNMLFYIFSRRLFNYFNRLNHVLSLAFLFIYAWAGLSYMIGYLDGEGYSKYFNTSMNTYSFIPLVLVILFWLGRGFTNLATARLNVEYKVYAKPDEPEVAKADGAPESDEEDEDEGAAVAAAKKDDTGVDDPIPAFSELDKNAPRYQAEYEARLAHKFEELTLPALVAHVIEYAKYSRERLSYGPVEVKTFMAGLAASRLSILQGMSGTGKTSLPKIFMEAIDGFCEIVAIESSWRDKNELLGYYNEFSKKYTPKTFTQYLYKACLNKEVPVFIVLDEMNLSRIEYYFSDFLSLMEARENMRCIKLFDVQLFPKIDQRTQYLALRDGHTIDIPTNVWFIGTANRDESTFEISDKVYDRAQTMNFDKRAAKVVVTEDKVIPKRYVPYSELRKLFDASRSIGFDAEKYETIKRVEKILAPYKISFGNRVLKQIEEFVNAYVACSHITSPQDTAKFTHEAIDCILFSKVVRKLELKQIIDIDSLIDDFTALNLPKSIEFLTTLRESV